MAVWGTPSARVRSSLSLRKPVLRPSKEERARVRDVALPTTREFLSQVELLRYSRPIDLEGGVEVPEGGRRAEAADVIDETRRQLISDANVGLVLGRKVREDVDLAGGVVDLVGRALRDGGSNAYLLRRFVQELRVE